MTSRHHFFLSNLWNELACDFIIHCLSCCACRVLTPTEIGDYLAEVEWASGSKWLNRQLLCSFQYLVSKSEAVLVQILPSSFASTVTFYYKQRSIYVYHKFVKLRKFSHRWSYSTSFLLFFLSIRWYLVGRKLFYECIVYLDQITLYNDIDIF